MLYGMLYVVMVNKDTAAFTSLVNIIEIVSG